MDLEALAETLEGPGARPAVAEWVAAVGHAEPEGPTVMCYLRRESNLQLHEEGLEAVRRFVRAVAARGPGHPVEWYRAVLNDAGLDLVPHGPEADPALPDELCKVADGWSVWLYLGGSGKPDIPPGITRSPRYRGVLEQWLRDFVCCPMYRDALDPAGLVSGNPPVVFSTFEEDRNSKFAAGIRADRCRQVVGLDPRPTPVAHVLLMYSRREVGPARVPTAFDAGTHLHFVPPPAGAPCGTTKNLTTEDGTDGVREVVVAPFPVTALGEPTFIERE